MKIDLSGVLGFSGFTHLKFAARLVSHKTNQGSDTFAPNPFHFNVRLVTYHSHSNTGMYASHSHSKTAGCLILTSRRPCVSFSLRDRAVGIILTLRQSCMSHSNSETGFMSHSHSRDRPVCLILTPKQDLCLIV